ncbi:MAG: ABC transporter substrate-binding protein [Alphaproteobacteria bacterium]|nr:ABC transporter substrate-binding protein [Alphaproteobacteria bacterium]
MVTRVPIRRWAPLALGLAVLVICAPFDAAAGDYKGRRILHIDSYHKGNEWNDRIAAAVRATLADTGVVLRVIHLDTKRNKSKEFKQAAAARAKKIIQTFDPDVVTTSDDNAAKYLIMQYYKDASLPFVFSGLNWDASTYGLPYSNVTGMVEVSPIPQIIALLQQHAKGKRLGLLTEDSPTKRKELLYHRKLFGLDYAKTYFVTTFDDWKNSFLRAQAEVDMLLLLGVAGVKGWDDAAAGRFAVANTRIPSGTDFGWLMHVSLLGVGKVPEEQGRWAAKAALKILDGVRPSDIPLAYNKEGQLYMNKTIAGRLGISDFPPLAKIVE